MRIPALRKTTIRFQPAQPLSLMVITSYGRGMTRITSSQSRRRPLRSLSAVVFAGALVLSACANGGAPQDPAGNGPETPPPETVTATESPVSNDNGAAGGNGAAGNHDAPAPAEPVADGAPQPMGNPDTAPKQQPGAGWTDLNVVDVRIATHGNFDRVVFDTDGEGFPGWFTDYTADPVQPGSGFPIEFDGSQALEVVITGALQPAEIGTITGAGGVVNEVVSGINHHGQTQFIIGMNEILPYSVHLIEEPQRVVVDILHAPADPVTPIGNPDTEAKAQDSAPPHQRVISDVRLATHEGFDRVVFDTVGEGTTGWFTEYTAEPTQLASGLPVEFDGSMALQVNLSGVITMTGGGYEQPIFGTIPGVGGAVNEVVSAVTHHGTSQFIIGLDDTLPHSIHVIEEPQRVVVDILHG